MGTCVACVCGGGVGGGRTCCWAMAMGLTIGGGSFLTTSLGPPPFASAACCEKKRAGKAGARGVRYNLERAATTAQSCAEERSMPSVQISKLQR